MIENIPSTTKKNCNPIQKSISKLEELGKRGKLHKLITITLDHFEFLKNSLNEYSLKILAYIIKGFFLSINKAYQYFIKELEEFIDINIRGSIKPKKMIKKIGSENHVETSEKFTLHNLSLFSENTFFEKFLENSNMTEQIQRTLQRINKTFAGIDFENMTIEQKRSYLKKNFIKPLTENIPMTADFFIMNHNECSQYEEGKHFADYIELDVDLLTENMLQSLHNSANRSQTIMNVEFLQGDLIEFPSKETEKQLVGVKLDKDPSYKYSVLKTDTYIEISLDNYLKTIDLKINEEDSDKTHYKNMKMLHKEIRLVQFITSIEDKGSMISKYFNEDYDSSQEQMRKEIKEFSNRTSPQSLQIADCSPNQMDLQPLEEQNGKEKKIVNSNSNSLSKVITLQEIIEERSKIQAVIKSIVSSMRNYEEFSISQLTRKVASNVKTFNEKTINEQTSSTFYNLMIACQNQQYSIKQSDLFGSLVYKKR